MGIGEAHAAKIGRGVGLDPHHLVEQPEAQVLQDGPHAVNVVVAADDPQRAVLFEHAAAGAQPFARKLVVGGKIGELVPRIMPPIHPCHIGPPQLLLQLQIVGRVGKYQIDAAGREACQHVAAITMVNRIRLHKSGAFLVATPSRARCPASHQHIIPRDCAVPWPIPRPIPRPDRRAMCVRALAARRGGYGRLHQITPKTFLATQRIVAYWVQDSTEGHILQV